MSAVWMESYPFWL